MPLAQHNTLTEQPVYCSAQSFVQSFQVPLQRYIRSGVVKSHVFQGQQSLPQADTGR